MTNPQKPVIAVLIPCYQEEKTIGKVVRDFKKVLPEAAIYVFDNNCTDNTARVAQEAGAMVYREKRQGKGHVVAGMFEQVDADIYVMVDGDDTYDAASVNLLLQPILRGDADMTVAGRLNQFGDKSFRNFHILGNHLVCYIINRMFGSSIRDIFSGYRAFTHEAARLIPITARGFDVETELTLQALYRGLVIQEIEAPYGERPEGSFSKLKTGSDGVLVLLKLFLMIRSYKPLTFFGGLSIVVLVLAMLSAIKPLAEFVVDHSVHSLGSAMLSATLVILSAFSLGLGLVLNSINLRLLEVEKLIRKWSSEPGPRK